MMQPRILEVRQMHSSSARAPENLNRVRGVFNCKCDRGTRVSNRERFPAESHRASLTEGTRAPRIVEELGRVA